MKRKMLKITMVILLLITLTMTNFIFVGASLYSYAVDNIATNHQNVEFNAELRENNRLFLQINVNNEGYFNGEITLEPSNFTLKHVDSEYVNSLEDNKIKLNQLNAGTTAQIEIEIEPIRKEIFDIGLLNMESKLNLTGIYRDSTEKNIEIKSTRTVKLDFIENNDEQNIEKNVEIITNKVVKIDGEEKRVVQLSLNMGLKENNYPIHTIDSKINVPVVEEKEPEILVNVEMNNMTSYDYKYENAKIALNMKNEPNTTNEVMWKKSGNEKVTLTLIYDKEAKIENSEIETSNKITLYNNKELNTTYKAIVDAEEKDAIIQTTITNAENSIFKGKLYAGIDRKYETTTKIDINLVGVAQYIEVQEEPNTYVYDNTNIDANTYYQQTKINKEELIKVLGKDGELTIFNQDGNIVATISATQETDEQGNIVVSYNDTVKGITIKTTEPKQVGSIHINHTKAIKKSEKEIVKSATAISTKVTQKYNTSEEFEENQTYSKGVELATEQKIELKETSTQATISMNKNSLSTLSTNNVEISAILKSSTEENDLYKNPKLQIILPQEVEEITVNSINKIYADEFEFNKAELKDVAGIGKVIEIELLGEQENYVSDVTQGIQVIINADITFSKITSTRESSIVMKYTNENGNQSEYEAKNNFNMVSKYGVLVYSKISGFNEKNTILESIEDGNLEGKLDIAGSSEKVITIERNIINNYDEAIQGIDIVGRIPEIGQEKINSKELKSTFTSSLQEITANLENAKIYYSEKIDIPSNSGEWQEEIEDLAKVKSYKIELPNRSLDQGEVLTISYKLKIPSDLKYDESTYEKLNISYQYEGQTISKDYATYLSTITNKDAKAIVKEENVNSMGNLTVSVISGGEELKDGQEIYAGQTVKVILTLTNDTGKDLKNVKITAMQDNATFYTEKVTQEMNTQTGEEMNVTNIVEDETIEAKEFMAETLKNGESISYEYQFSVKEKIGEETKGTITLEADGIEKQEITTIINKIKDAKLKLNIKCNYNEERVVLAGSVLPITLTTENISDKELKNVVIELPIPEGTTLEEMYIVPEDNYSYLGIEDGIAKFKINSINPREKVEIILSLTLDDFKEDATQIDVYYKATANKDTYISNELIKEAIQEKADISVTQKGNRNVSTVKTGEEVIYTTIIKNASNREQPIEIIDNVPTAAVVKSAYIISDGNQIKADDITDNKVTLKTGLTQGQEIEFVVETTIDENLAETSEITNAVEVNAYNQYIKSNDITYRLANIVDDNTNQEINNSISGRIWLDSNRNGQIDEEETGIKGLEVTLLNAITGETAKDSNNQEIKTTTDDQGKYQFTKLANNKYMVLIQYDTTKYSLTEYKKTGLKEELNSDVIAKEVDGKTVAITDEIEVKDNNTEYVNAGLVENKIFDLRLDKYINKVTIQMQTGTKVVEYNKAQLAKVELDAKQINNTTVLVEYGIDITNEGEVAGYANEIIDYLPNNFKFSSEINKSWYTTTDENKLHNISLANEIINPGETKTVTLTLVKTMNENNVGTTVNTAEIAKASNDLLISDKDSTANNKANGEDDISTAELIISIKTGVGLAIGIGLIIIIVLVISAIIIIVKKRRKENE